MNDLKTDKKKSKGEDDLAVDPVHTIREGAIGASIWLRQSPSGFAYYDFTLSRSWLSKASGKTGYSKGFFDRNEKELVSVVERAVAWIRTHQEKLPSHELAEVRAA